MKMYYNKKGIRKSKSNSIKTFNAIFFHLSRIPILLPAICQV